MLTEKFGGDEPPQPPRVLSCAIRTACKTSEKPRQPEARKRDAETGQASLYLGQGGRQGSSTELSASSLVEGHTVLVRPMTDSGDLQI